VDGERRLSTCVHGQADKEAREEDAWTPLHFAAASGNEAVVNTLLCNGANSQAIDGNSRSALHFASQVENVTLVKLLLAF
jgi:ankyrin repeat protein